MRRIFITGLFFFVLSASYAQYYYNDIVSLKTSNQLYLNLVKNNIHEVTAQSLGSDNTPTANFYYDRHIENNGALIITNTTLEATGATISFEHYANDLLVQSVDSSANSTTNVNYKYNEQGGNIALIETQTVDTSASMQTEEKHQWFYTTNIPDSMLRIKDNADTTVVHFIKDDRKNIIEETWQKKNKTIEHYYYYYDDKNRLTDIVRFNLLAKQMLPDFIFEYNDNGSAAQMTEIPQGSSDYIIWAYIYDERGLKTTDILYDKHHQLLGTVNYSYQ